MKKNHHKKGFTLLEVIVVITIFALATLISITWIGNIDKYKFKENLKKMASGIKHSFLLSLINGENTEIIIYPHCRKVIIKNEKKTFKISFSGNVKCYLLINKEKNQINEKVIFWIKNGTTNLPAILFKKKNFELELDPQKLSLFNTNF